MGSLSTRLLVQNLRLLVLVEELQDAILSNSTDAIGAIVAATEQSHHNDLVLTKVHSGFDLPHVVDVHSSTGCSLSSLCGNREVAIDPNRSIGKAIRILADDAVN